LSLSRRKFIKAGAIAAACVGLPASLAQAASGRAPLLNRSVESLLLEQHPPTVSSLDLLGYYDKSAFIPYVNTKFNVYLGESNVRGVTLKKVSDYLQLSDSLAAVSGSECFSLLFTIAPGNPFQQDTYRIEHEALGAFYMFVVPVSPHKNKSLDYYEAVIFRQRRGEQATNTVAGVQPVIITEAKPIITTVTPRPVWMPWRVSAETRVESPAEGRKAKVERDIYNFSSLGTIAPVVAVEANDKPHVPVQATWLSMADDRGINGLRLGMTTEQVLALFPGSKVDEEVRVSLSNPTSPLGLSGFTIRPEKYSSKSKFDGISQIVFTLLDNRVSTLYVGYDNSTTLGNVDEFVTKFSKGRKLPAAESWEPYVGMDNQLKTMKCKDYEIMVFAGGENVSVSYVQLSDLTARRKLKERRAEAKRKKPVEAKQ
jgi:hypothetical protein